MICTFKPHSSKQRCTKLSVILNFTLTLALTLTLDLIFLDNGVDVDVDVEIEFKIFRRWSLGVDIESRHFDFVLSTMTLRFFHKCPRMQVFRGEYDFEHLR